MSRENRPAWFKMFLHHKKLVYTYSAEDVGNGVKAAFAYFDVGEVPDSDNMTPNATSIFIVMQEYIDEAFAEYQSRVENGKKGVRPKNQ